MIVAQLGSIKFESDGLPKEVSQIHLTAFKNESNKGGGDSNPAANHWCMFLELSGERSVRIDMVPGYGSDWLRGKIQISSKNYPYTRNSTKTCVFPITHGVTVQRIVDLISSTGRQKYQFTPEREGCRFWNLTVTKDLQSAGYVPPKSVEEAENVLSMYWAFPAGSERREIKLHLQQRQIRNVDLDEKYTGETLHAFTYQPLRTAKVDDFLGLVCETGRDAFDFSPEWERCRFWLTVVMRDSEDAGWLEKGSADEAKEALEMYWRNPEGSEPRVMREGTFRE
ncbi:hypothetical protein B0T18DRAFT_447427 [Schizothecium vesticola]|uniref:DUF7770 domain-containing protein n=1 Tax=Schizothecium vesticola TaxID=314040 RepID=A0AA40EWX2_9PEZI|nr:hypothetical protein B0T18DRAFT_447427 [Schizothecium vesticola]